jgi:hypothetical protein
MHFIITDLFIAHFEIVLAEVYDVSQYISSGEGMTPPNIPAVF